ncbi:MAG: DUF4097 family beta strand repeat protein [Anaerolineaceae bacterium]|nr:DUF4097 family beta strand repeat protein [Anaerolineaceae bacterium]
MKLKWLWIILLVLMIMVVCGLIVSVLGMGIYSFTSISSQSNSSGPVIDRLFNDEIFRGQLISMETTEDKTFLIGSEAITLVVENQFGNVVVQGKETDEIYMSVLKTAWGSSDEVATQNLEVLEYEVIEEPGRLTIRVLEPDKMLNRPGTIDFKMDIPINTSVSFETKNGDLYAANLLGGVDLDTSFGNVEVRDIQDGKVNADSKNGNITLRGINVVDFPVSVKTEFGDVNIFQANAEQLTASITNGRMSLENIKVTGDIDISNNFGDVGYRSGQASNLKVNSVNGKITLTGVKVDEKLIAYTDFGNVELAETLAADYDLLTKNGRIDLNGAENANIKVVTDFGDIELVNIKSSIIDAETKNGSIIVNGSLAEGNHRMTSDFGSITLRMPANQSVDCDIKTNFGKINSEFELTVSGAIDEKHFVGKINDGGGLLTIETQNGNITLEKTTIVEEK